MSVPRRIVKLAPVAQRDYDDILLHSFLTWGEYQMEQYRSTLDGAFVDLEDFP
ncbi:MAG: hypothetical protein ACR2OO_03490 [Thermomicrobiales bacterium]